MKWWHRLLTAVAGAAITTAGVLTGQPLLVTAGVGVIGWATPFPSSSSKKTGGSSGTGTNPPTLPRLGH